MEGLQEQIEQWELDKKEKKTMSVSTIKFSITYKDQIFDLTITPKGKGFYDIKCVITKKHNMFNQQTLTLENYFCHSISMNRAKDIVLEFNDFNKK